MDDDLNEVAHGLSNLLMGNSLGHLRSQVVLLDVAGRGAGTELHVRDTFKGDNWEHPVLSALNVVSTVIPCFGNAGDTHESILGSTDREGRNIGKVSSSIFVHLAVIACQNRSHGDETLDLVGVSSSVLLGHDTTEGVTSEEDVVSSESSSLEVLEGRLDVDVDGHWVR